MVVSAPITVGSSDVASILGLSRYRSQQETWCQLVGLVPRYDHAQANTEQARGHLLEKALLIDWEDRNERKLTRGVSISQAPSHTRDGWKHARPDGWIPSEIIVEAKSTRAFDAHEIVLDYQPDGTCTQRTFAGWGEDGSSQVPMSYKAQVVWQMHVLDVPRVEVTAFATLSEEQRSFVLERDMHAEAIIVAKVEAFMVAYVWRETLTPPPPLNYEVVHAMHRDGGQSKEWLAPSPDDETAVSELRDIAARVKTSETRAKHLKATLCDRIGDAYGIDGLCRWERAISKETVALAKVRKTAPDLYAALEGRGFINRSQPARRFVLLGADTDEA